jgi:YD repeat-containing protein
MNLSLRLLLSVFLLPVAAAAQTIGFPDSATVVKNKVKRVSIYFESADGQRDLQKQLEYDKSGRIVTERQNPNTFYFEYTYDAKGRKISSVMKTKDGNRSQEITEEYIDKDTSRKQRLYFADDGQQPSFIYYYDKHGRKTREEQYNKLGLVGQFRYSYNSAGELISTYDSVGYQHTASVRKNNVLTERHVYNADGQLLHWYTFTYNDRNQIATITDSTGVQPTQKYVIEYRQQSTATGALRNGQKLPEQNWVELKKELFYLFPDGPTIERETDLPIPEVVNEHHYTYDKKGNIMRDDLVQKMGSFSQTYVYTYEYQYY